MKYLLYILIPFIIVSIYSCGEPTTEINWEADDPFITLSVEGFISTDSINHSITLRSTHAYFNGLEPPLVSDANVEVTTTNSVYTFSESDTLPGVYRSDIVFKGIVGETYNLNIELENSLDGKSTFTASAILKKGFDISYMEAVEYEVASFDDEDSTAIIIAYIAEDPSPEVNYYFYRLYVEDSLMTDSLRKIILYNDEYLEDENTHYLFLSHDIPVGKLLTLEVYSVSKEYYYFLDGIKKISYPMDPLGFSAPHADVKGNINNGAAYGYFWCTDVSRFTVPVQPEQLTEP